MSIRHSGFRARLRWALIVIPCLKKIDPDVANEVYKAMLLGKATRPDAGGEILEWFRFANACKGIAHDGLDKVECTQGSLAIDFDPVAEVFPELRLEDSFSNAYFSKPSSFRSFSEVEGSPSSFKARVRMRGAVCAFFGERMR